MNVLDDYLVAPEISLLDMTRIQAQVRSGAKESYSGSPALRSPSKKSLSSLGSLNAMSRRAVPEIV